MIFLRNISVSDNIVLAKIHQASFSDGWSESSFQNMLMDPTFFGFIIGHEKNGQKQDCGFILCRRILEEIEIITLCVSPEHRRFGLGKLLIIEMIKQAGFLLKQEADYLESIKIFLEVAENNTTAIHLYSAFGFEKISRRSKYYRTPNGNIDAHIMVLKVCDEQGE
jgi:ribosomal-protein-alanine N-acetyltransferase